MFSLVSGLLMKELKTIYLNILFIVLTFFLCLPFASHTC